VDINHLILLVDIIISIALASNYINIEVFKSNQPFKCEMLSLHVMKTRSCHVPSENETTSE